MIASVRGVILALQCEQPLIGLCDACAAITFAIPVLLVVLTRFVYEVRTAAASLVSAAQRRFVHVAKLDGLTQSVGLWYLRFPTRYTLCGTSCAQCFVWRM